MKQAEWRTAMGTGLANGTWQDRTGKSNYKEAGQEALQVVGWVPNGSPQPGNLKIGTN